MKLLSFYLPQYHAIPENDEWWGTGFTEWYNVKYAKKLFNGHKQPRVPMNENYYNLLDDNIKAWQIDLAKKNGIYGFCFYHYWFDGKLMLEKPVEQFLSNLNLDFPFCLCWANPPWTKIWAGQGSKVLINQKYGDQHAWEMHFKYLLPYFRDKRYVKDNEMPLFIIYEPSEIPCIEEMLTYFKTRIIEEGFLGIKFAYQYYQKPLDDIKIRTIFDYDIEFQPLYALQAMERKARCKAIMQFIDELIYKITSIKMSDHLHKLRITDYDKVWMNILSTSPKDDKSIPGAFVDWDNTPRRKNAGRVISGGTPRKFEEYLAKQIKHARNEYKTDYLFITAWNEWSEGSYLEPDEANEYGYLEAIKNALVKNDEFPIIDK